MRRTLTPLTVFALAVVLASSPALGQTGNIDPAQRHAWAENAGWLDFRPVHGGVTVLSTHLTGYAWHENVGWVKLGSDAGGPYANTTETNWGVNVDVVTGHLSGFAWSENAGWIRFDPPYGGVHLAASRKLSEYAWSENLGWIRFESPVPGYGVAVLCSGIPPTGTVTGGGAICAGRSATVTVTVSGGTPPYTVTLTSGGGTQVGNGPVFTFSVSPDRSTNYSVGSLWDALCCNGPGIGNALVSSAVPFGGVTSVAPEGGGACALRLEWTSAGAGYVYNVYRSTGPYPSPATRIASCVTNNFYLDGTVASGTGYYYRVRAEGATPGSGGPCRNGCEDLNIAVRWGGIICDGTPAPDVQSLTVTSGNGTNRLEWVNPPSGTDYSHKVIVRKLGSYPANPTDVGPGGDTWNSPKSTSVVEGFDDTPLTNGTTYYYGVWVYRSTGDVYSAGQFNTGRPMDTATPVKWAYSTGASALAPPGIGYPSGGAYVVSNDRRLHAMKPGTAGGTWPDGWMPMVVNAPAQSRPPIVTTSLVAGASRVVFLGSQDGYAYAVNADTGALLWTSPRLGDAVQTGTAGTLALYGGLLFYGSWNATADNVLHALHVSDGTSAWTFDNAPGGGIGIISGSASVDVTNQRIYFTSRRRPGGSQDTVWCIAFTGTGATKVWSVDLGDVDASPILDGTSLYVGTNEGTVHKLDAATGDPRWAAPFSTSDGPVKAFVWKDSSQLRLYFSTTTKVWALRDGRTSATAYWTAPISTIPSPSNPLLNGSVLYVGGGDGKLYEIEAGTPTPGAPKSVTLGDGTAAVGSPSYDVLSMLVHVGTDAGTIYAVQTPLP